jgi:hypothetical protein
MSSLAQTTLFQAYAVLGFLIETLVPVLTLGIFNAYSVKRFRQDGQGRASA